MGKRAPVNDYLLRNSGVDIEQLGRRHLDRHGQLLSSLEEYRVAIEQPLLPFEPLERDLKPHLVRRQQTEHNSCLIDLIDLESALQADPNDPRHLKVAAHLAGHGRTLVSRNALVLWRR